MRKRLALLLLSLLPAAASAGLAAENFDDAVKRAVSDYDQRLVQASAELNQTRARIADEKAPYLKAMRSAEDRIIAAETEITRLRAAEAQAENRRLRLRKEADTLRNNLNYLDTLAHDGLKAEAETLGPGEEGPLSDRLQALEQELDPSTSSPKAQAAADVADFLLARTEEQLGGYAVAGRSTIDGDDRVHPGFFAFEGPETYFLASDGAGAGMARSREGATYPIAYPLPAWRPEAAEAFFQGGLAPLVEDASGGKALRLKETQGTIWTHIQKGGVVAYVIIGVGFLSLILIVQKARDLSQLQVDDTRERQGFLGELREGDSAGAERRLGSLKAATRELYETGLRHLAEPKAILEERLETVLLRQRIHFERWLPLLAVIATAAPLMGLLGTVIGMIKTFALITVFGTGNAGRLSSGISEVLISTELGLIVAIPTLVAHGFLAQRIQKKLSTLEGAALEFATAAELSKSGAARDNAAESVPS